MGNKRRVNSRTSRAQREDSIRRTVYVSDIDQQVRLRLSLPLSVQQMTVPYKKACPPVNTDIWVQCPRKRNAGSHSSWVESQPQLALCRSPWKKVDSLILWTRTTSCERVLIGPNHSPIIWFFLDLWSQLRVQEGAIECLTRQSKELSMLRFSSGLLLLSFQLHLLLLTCWQKTAYSLCICITSAFWRWDQGFEFKMHILES